MAGVMSTLRQAWWLGSFVLLAFAGGVHAAGTLQDPTRPAIGMPAAGTADSAGTAATELQSILRQPGRKPRALAFASQQQCLQGGACELGDALAPVREAHRAK